MKNFAKIFILGAMSIGALVGCDFGNNNSSVTPSSSSEISNSDSSTLDSSNSSVLSSSIAPIATGITLNTDNVNKNYVIGQALNLSGLVVNINYNDGSSKETKNYTTDPADGANLSTGGQREITVTVDNFTAKFNIFVKEQTGISLNTDNVKKEYDEGDSLDLTGLSVALNFNDGTSEPIDSYIATPAHDDYLYKLGTNEVTITYNEFSASFNINVTSLWSSEYASLMSENLHGELLPFTDAESVVTYDENNEVIYISGGVLWNDSLEVYAQRLELFGYSQLDEEGHYFQKEITTTAGTRYVRVYVTSSGNQYYIEAYDPFYYAFPAGFARAVALSYFNSNVVIPAIDAKYYSISTTYLYISCYIDESDSDDAGYGAILAAKGWDIQDEKDSDGYYVAISPDGTYTTAYLWDDGVLEIYFIPVSFWNKTVVDSFFTKYNFDVVDIPTFDTVNDDVYYQFLEPISSDGTDYNALYAYMGMYEAIHATMYIFGATTSDLLVYKAKLSALGWEVTGSENSYAAKLLIEDKGYARIEFGYDGTIDGAYVTVYVKLDPLTEATWPTDGVAAILGSEITDTVPAFEGENKGFTLVNDSFGTAVMVYVENGTENTALTSYIATLGTAEYVEKGVDGYGSPRYVSKNGQILVTVYSATAGILTIEFREAPLFEFPSDLLIASFPNATDTIPALNGALEYDYQFVGRLATVSCVFAGTSAANQALAAYDAALRQAEFTILGQDPNGDTHYDSPNHYFEVCPYVGRSGTLYIYIQGPEQPAESNWPIAKLTEDFGETIAKAIPEYPNGKSYEFFISGPLYEIMVEVDDGDAAVTEYIGILTQAGFTTTYVDDLDDTHYVSDDGVIDICPWAEDEKTLDIDIIINLWPTKTITGLFTSKGISDPLPAYEGNYSSAEAYEYYDNNIYVDIETTDDDALTSYNSTLLEAGFKPLGQNSYGDYLYNSPSIQYSVTVSYNSRYGMMQIKIEKLAGGETSDSFPMAGIVAKFPTAENVLPAIEGNASYTLDTPFEGEATLTATFATKEEATVAYNAYTAALLQADFKYETVWGSDVYVSPDRKYMLGFDISKLDEGSFEVCFMDTYGQV